MLNLKEDSKDLKRWRYPKLDLLTCCVRIAQSLWNGNIGIRFKFETRFHGFHGNQIY